MSQSVDEFGNRNDGVEELYAKPYKPGRKNDSQQIVSNQSDGIYDRLDRQSSMRSRNGSSREASSAVDKSMRPKPEGTIAPDEERGPDNLRRSDNDLYDDVASEQTGQRSLASQSVQQNDSEEMSDDIKLYQIDFLEAKDTNDIIRELNRLGMEEQSNRLALALRSRFELEGAFIDTCADDGVAIMEGDDDDDADAFEHQSIGGLRVRGMKPAFVNYDEYDPDIIKKYGYFAQGFSREKMASDAADLRRHAANMLWTVENMERMIDPNSRVRYVRHENSD